MTIEVTLLKTIHNGKQEARKLLPFIQNCGIYAPEGALCTEEKAIKEESLWERVLSTFTSRTELKKRYKVNNPDEGNRVFRETVDEYLFINKKPIWLVERHAPADEQQLRFLLKETYRLHKDEYEFIMNGEIATALDTYLRNIQHTKKLIEIRDRHIAKNIEMAEEQILKRYPALKSCNPLSFVVELGYMHNPQKYTAIPIKVHDLTTDSNILPIRQSRAIEREDLEEVKKCELEVMILSLADNKVHPFTSVQLEKMTFGELLETVKMASSGKNFGADVTQ